MIKTIRIILAAVFFSMVSIAAHGETITVSYLDRPPYYFTKNGRAAGFLVDTTRMIFEDAGIKATYICLPPKRIIAEIKRNNRPHCSIGWFKTRERESYADFSLPIYRDRPTVVLTLKQNRPLFSRHSNIGGLFADGKLVMGKVSAFSHGAYIDGLTAKTKNSSHRIYEVKGTRSQLVKMISTRRISYILVAPEEIHPLLTSAGLNPNHFAAIAYEDVPSGNMRHLIFSKGIPVRTITKINQSIMKLIGEIK